MSEDYVKKLAELKKQLETRKKQIEDELDLININLNLIDKALAESSFTTASELLQKKEEVPEIKQQEVYTQPKEKAKAVHVEKIVDIDGYLLSTLNFYQNNTIEIIPNPDLKFKEDISPFKNFLIKKVFDGKKTTDIESGKKVEEAFDYEIIKDNEGNVTQIILKNINIEDQSSIKNLTNSIKWTMKRIREKLKGV
jgi:hypothetical protein